MKSLFEEHNGRYVRCGEYLIPEMGLTQEEQKPLGKYGMMRRRMNLLHDCAEETVMNELVYA